MKILATRVSKEIAQATIRKMKKESPFDFFWTTRNEDDSWTILCHKEEL